MVTDEEHVAHRRRLEERERPSRAHREHMTERLRARERGGVAGEPLQGPLTLPLGKARSLRINEDAGARPDTYLERANRLDFPLRIDPVARHEVVGQKVPGDVDAGVGEELALQHVTELELVAIGDEDRGQEHVDDARVTHEDEDGAALRRELVAVDLEAKREERPHRRELHARVEALNGPRQGLSPGPRSERREPYGAEEPEPEGLDEQERSEEEHETDRYEGAARGGLEKIEDQRERDERGERGDGDREGQENPWNRDDPPPDAPRERLALLASSGALARDAIIVAHGGSRTATVSTYHGDARRAAFRSRARGEGCIAARMQRALRPLRVLASCLALGLALPACGGDDTGSGGGGGAKAVARPNDPAANDPAFLVAGAPRYVLAGDNLTPPTESFQLHVTPPAGASVLDLWLDDAAEPLPLEQAGSELVLTVDSKVLSLGDHHIMLAERGAEAGFFGADFVKGHALYMVISTDWDFPDVADEVLAHHEELHVSHPELKITHLIGPYTFTDPAVPQERRDLIVSWAKAMRDDHGDEIGLHIHPRCTFVEAAGLTCATQPSVSEPDGDPTGYTVHLGAYSRDEWNVMFAKADEIWANVGFGKPTSFRAGAWTLEIPVAQALADSGFVVDSSAVNWAYLEEWEGEDLYSWNQQQWMPIGDASQPYHPTDDAILPGGAGAEIGILEVPDNGAMVDYWTVAEMTAIFDANWSGGALQAPIQVSTGFHPAPTMFYSKAEYKRLDQFFTYTDQFLASQTLGPVVYIKMSDAVKVW